MKNSFYVAGLILMALFIIQIVSSLIINFHFAIQNW